MFVLQIGSCLGRDHYCNYFVPWTSDLPAYTSLPATVVRLVYNFCYLGITKRTSRTVTLVIYTIRIRNPVPVLGSMRMPFLGPRG